jgi:hypothetical protein
MLTMGGLLGIFDIQTSTMTMSRFHAAPRLGHLTRLKRMYGYLKKFVSAAIRVRLWEPDLGELPDQNGVTVCTVMLKS